MPRVTRRSVVKLAYAAPLVAASMQLSSITAFAASPPPCAPGSVRSCGRVVDQQGRPIEGVLYDAARFGGAYTDANGRFDACKPAPGECCLDDTGLFKDGYCPLHYAHGDEQCKPVFVMLRVDGNGLC
jgi:hypothetical protein